MGNTFDGLSGKIIAAAVEVHKRLGPGFLESVYEEALSIELKKRGIAFERQKPVEIRYDGLLIGKHILDLLVEDLIIVELKAVKNFEDIYSALLRSYLRATNKRIGLLFNFNSPTLAIKRVVN